MTKRELQEVVKELREGTYYENIDCEPIIGIGLPDFTANKRERKHIRKEVIVNFLRWQTGMLNGEIDETELSSCLYLLSKKVLMV